MKKFLIFFTIIAVVVGIALLRSNPFSQESPGVEVAPLEERIIRSSILASGRLSHDEEVLISTEVIGRVTDLFIEEADEVQKGELLMQIDNEQPLAIVQQQRASVRIQEIAIEGQKLRLENLKKKWERQRRLFEQDLVDDDTFEVATNEVDLAQNDLLSRQEQLQQARASLEEAENRLQKTSVYSPITGVVTSLDIKVGEMAISSTTNVPGSSLMTIANPDSMLTEVNVDEADIANVEVGQEAEIVAIAYPDQPMKGRVQSIAVSAKQASGSQSLSFAVKIALTDTSGITLRPGMSCRAEIFTNTDTPALAIPIQAIQIEEDRTENVTRYQVFLYDNGVARQTEIEVGISDDQYQEVLSGVNKGDQIIVGPNRAIRTLDDGAAVIITETSQP